MKKVLSLMLVLVLVLGMSTVAFAADILKVNKDSTIKVTFPNTHTNIIAEAQNTNLNYSYPISFAGVEAKFGNLTTTWNNTDVLASNGNTDNTKMTERQRKDNKVTIKTIIQKGSSAIDEVKFTSAGTAVNTPGESQELTLVLNKTLKTNNTDGVDFEVKSYLVIDGRHWNADANIARWEGNLKNKSETVNADYDYVWMGVGTIVEADEYIKEIECDLGEGVLVTAKMFKDKKYWAKATTDPKNDDEEIMMDKAGIDVVYHLDNVGLAAVTTTVSLSDEDSSMFVYDGNFKYLGKGSDPLPWSDTYYLAAQQLDVEDEDEPVDEEVEEEGESDPPETSEDLGGDDDYPANVNDNPGTGC